MSTADLEKTPHAIEAVGTEGTNNGNASPAYHAVGEKGSDQQVENVLEHELTAHLELLDAAHQNGRLVVEIEEARREYGAHVAVKFKLTPDGKYILWPQPTEDPRDPLNWSWNKKMLTLVVLTMASIVPDFNSSIGIACLFPLAEQFNTTVNHVNNLTSNWSIFLLGPGGVVAVILVNVIGRLPILFWSQILGVAFLIGCTVAPDLATVAGMRCLSAFFSTAPQVTGLFIVRDIFFFHQEARMLNAWAFGFVVSPYLGPFLFGFLVQRQTWRWAYGIGCIYEGIVVLLIVLFVEETLYERDSKDRPKIETGMWARIKALVGITGYQRRHFHMPFWTSFWRPFLVNFQPQEILSLAYVALNFAWAIGINTTLVVFLQSPPPLGYSFSGDAVAVFYLTPIIATVLGEIVSHYLQDFFTNRYIRRHNGVFEPEARLWMCYIGSTLNFAGLMCLGGTLQNHASIAGLVFGWGLFTLGMMIIISAMYTYMSDAFPAYQGEVSCLFNLWRTFAGFAVAYFQVPWSEKSGALVVFGCEAAIVVFIFVAVVPILQIWGKAIRTRFSSLSGH
ncbi:MFS general substrate transporter [Dacryopinax primogenitus]|uniref:MFS general substrate transporter n=1 Tax=Dacryopinax primogenitus (strain DJM 731) TaxID=1858805 RepID=M5G2L7_DACPD|nr:MFS general substrate transporter [Dacryopinax primogenitus]EJT98007.1 MFS general substrate transporter [Dacryopinax primogenitus]